MLCRLLCSFVFNDTATTQIYTLSLHDALPISGLSSFRQAEPRSVPLRSTSRGTNRLGRFHSSLAGITAAESSEDRKSTRLNSSHRCISYAVFCLKKKTLVLPRLASADRSSKNR